MNTSIQVAGRSSQKREREKARGSGGGLSVTSGNSSRFDAGRGLQNRSERLEGVNAFSSVPRPAFVSGCIFAPRARSLSGNVTLLRKRNKFYREDLRPALVARPIREKQLPEDPGAVQADCLAAWSSQQGTKEGLLLCHQRLYSLLGQLHHALQLAVIKDLVFRCGL